MSPRPSKGTSKPKPKATKVSARPKPKRVVVVVRKVPKNPTTVASPQVSTEGESTPSRQVTGRQLQQDIRQTNRQLIDLGLIPLTRSSELEEELPEDPPPRPSSTAPSEDSSASQDEPLVRSDSLSLDECLQDPSISLTFWSYLRSQYTHEVLSFWLVVQEYKTVDQPIRQSKAREIVQKYLRPGAEYELTAGSDLRLAIESEVETSPSQNTFDELEEVTWNLLLYEFLPKFLSSEFFRNHQNGKTIPLAKLKELKRSPTYQRLQRFQRTGSFRIQHSSVSANPKRTSHILQNQGYGVAFGVRRGSCAPPCVCDGYFPHTKDGICGCGHWPGKDCQPVTEKPNTRIWGKLPFVSQISSTIRRK